MQKANAPIQFTLAFAGSAASQYRNTIPIPSQQGTTPGAASFTDGFPPVTMEPEASGGIPPYGADMNGILYDSTMAAIWQQAGFLYPYNSSFATNANINGYPAGALLGSSTGANVWFNTADNNTTNPDTSAGAGYLPILPNSGKVSVNTTGGTATITANQLNGPLITITGALTSNAVLNLPLRAGQQYIVQNNTTGSFTVTIQSSTGAGVQIAQGSPQSVFCDGTNWYTDSMTGGPYLPLHGTADAAAKLATAQNISITGKLNAGPVSFNGTAPVALNITSVVADNLATPRAFQLSGYASSNSVNFDGTGPVTLNVTGLNVPAALGYTPANDAQVMHLAGAETATGVKTFPGVVSIPPSDPDTRAYIAKPAGAGTAYGALGAIAAYGAYLTANVYYDSAWHQVDATRNSAYLALNWASGSFYFGTSPAGSSAIVNKLSVDSSGNATLTGTCTATGYNTSASSRVVKHDIAPCRYGLKELLQIPWAEYRYDKCITEDDRLRFMAIVEDIEAFVPLLVIRREGNVPTLEPDQFIPVIGRALQEYVAQTEARFARLEARA